MSVLDLNGGRIFKLVDRGMYRIENWELLIIGASLSESHTGMTSLRLVCLFVLLIAWADHLL